MRRWPFKPVYVDVGQGNEEWVRLTVDGKPFAAMSRDRFLGLFEQELIHETFHGEGPLPC